MDFLETADDKDWETDNEVRARVFEHNVIIGEPFTGTEDVKVFFNLFKINLQSILPIQVKKTVELYSSH